MSLLVIDKPNMSIMDTYFKGYLKYSLQIPKDAPDPLVYLVSGTLPIPALIHLRQFSLVLQLKRLGLNHSLFVHAVNILQSQPPPSWL